MTDKYYIAQVWCGNNSGNPKFGVAMFPIFLSLEDLRKEYAEPIGFYEVDALPATIDGRTR